jgi:hypothetical protein
MSINSDKEFKTALNGLALNRQRQVAAHFIDSVLSLCGDARVVGAANAAKRADVSEAELAALYQAAKSASVESFTQCGKEADWAAQAGHFVARAAMECVQPAADSSLAWNVAIESRMACTFAAIASGEGSETREATAQHRILESFLSETPS